MDTLQKGRANRECAEMAKSLSKVGTNLARLESFDLSVIIKRLKQLGSAKRATVRKQFLTLNTYLADPLSTLL